MEVRSVSTDSGSAHEISGYAMKFDVPSQDIGFTEYITKSALDNVDLNKLLLLREHDPHAILARADSGTLQTKIDDIGLYFTAQLADTTLANDLVADIEAGNIKGCSFTFNVADDENADIWGTDSGGNTVRQVNKIDTIMELTLTALPAYQETSVSVQRSLDLFNKKKQEKRSEKLDEKEKKTEKVNKQDDLASVLSALKTAIDSLTSAKDDKESEKKDDKRSIDEAKKDETKPAKDDEKKEAEKRSDEADKKEPAEKETDDKKETETDKKDEKRSLEEGKKDKDKSSQLNVKETDEQKTEKTEKRSKDLGKKITENVEETKKKDEMRSFIGFLKGEKRDATSAGMAGGFNSVDGEAVLPSQVLDVLEQPNEPSLLSGYVNRVQVTAPTGKLPILAKATAQLASAEELAENPDIGKAQIDKVKYDVVTYRGALPVAIEMVQDYPNITSMLAKYVKNVKDRTEQRKIGTVLQQATAVTAKSIDDIKGVYNSDDLVWYIDKMIVVTASAFNWLDSQKDANGRYLLQDSISAATGKTLFGAQVVKVADDVLGAKGDMKMFIGDLSSFVFEAVRADLSVQWVRNEEFGQILQAVLRADFQVGDKDAGKFITVNAAAPSAPASGK